jgi:hypothetical protein
MLGSLVLRFVCCGVCNAKQRAVLFIFAPSAFYERIALTHELVSIALFAQFSKVSVLVCSLHTSPIGSILCL